MTRLEKVFQSYNITLKENQKYRHIVDILEDLYIKLNTDEYINLMSQIADIESKEGMIFDEARQKPYE